MHNLSFRESNVVNSVIPFVYHAVYENLDDGKENISPENPVKNLLSDENKWLVLKEFNHDELEKIKVNIEKIFGSKENYSFEDLQKLESHLYNKFTMTVEAWYKLKHQEQNNSVNTMKEKLTTDANFPPIQKENFALYENILKTIEAQKTAFVNPNVNHERAL